MLSGLETTRILRQFEEQYLPDREGDDHLNDEMGASAQKTFKKQVNHLANVIRRMGNPFLDDFPELITLDSRDCLDDSVAESVFNFQELGKTQYQHYVKDVIQARSIFIGSTIKRNKLPFTANNPRSLNLNSQRKSRHCRTTSPCLLSYILPWRAVMLILRNFSVTRCSHSHHRCLNSEIFAYEV